MPEPEKYQETRARYRETHKEERRALDKQIYEINKEKRIDQITQWKTDNVDKLTTKIECLCGGKHQHRTKAEHERSKRHQKYITSLN